MKETMKECFCGTLNLRHDQKDCEAFTTMLTALDSIFKRGTVSSGLQSVCRRRPTIAGLNQDIEAMKKLAGDAIDKVTTVNA